MANKKATTAQPVQKNRFVISKAQVGKGVVITFTNKKGQKWTYDHDEVYNAHKERFESMNCFEKYGTYTNSNAVPKFARELTGTTMEETAAE
jgi:hypothetical protein